MKYLKTFENINSVNIHSPGSYDTEIKHCFDGFEDLNLHVKELSGIKKGSKNEFLGTIIVTRRHEKFAAVPFKIDDDIKDELISSIGKVEEIGYKLEKLSIVSNREIEFVPSRSIHEIEELNIGILAFSILIHFKKLFNDISIG